MLLQIFLEDAGFDWKVLGPDVRDVDYVAWQCDQDAYACSGQKCSAQSLLFMHKNWSQAGAVCQLSTCTSLPDLHSSRQCSVHFLRNLTVTQKLPQCEVQGRRQFIIFAQAGSDVLFFRAASDSMMSQSRECELLPMQVWWTSWLP